MKEEFLFISLSENNSFKNKKILIKKKNKVFAYFITVYSKFK